MMSSDRIKYTARRIALLRGHFIHHDRFEPLEARFPLLIEKRLADCETRQTSEAHGLALSGPSGAGKTSAMVQLMVRSRKWLERSGHEDFSIVSIRVPAPATLKFVGQTLLRALGYQISSERQAWYIWDLVRHHLKERKVLFVHLDEAQDLASRGRRHELNSVASMLKTLMTDPEWPVGIILSGTPELEDILNHDPQLARRMDTVHFESLSSVAHANDVLDLIESARSAFGISGWKLGRRLAAIGLAQRSSVSKRFVLNEYAPTNVVRSIVTEVDALLNATEAAEHVGIDRMMIPKFTDRGLIPKYYPDHNATPLYHPKDLEIFLGRLRSLAAGNAGSDQYLNIPAASKRLGLPTDRVSQIILDHQVPLIADQPKAARFRDFRISLTDLQQAIAREQDDSLRPADAAKAMRISVRTVRNLLDQGILEPRAIREQRSARIRRYVSASSIVKFSGEYITVVDLASQSGRLPGAEAILQMDRGIQPLNLGARCNMIFRRTDLSRPPT